MRSSVGWAGLLWLCAAPGAWAGQYVLQAGQTQTVPVAARVVNGETRCHLRISVPGQADVDRVVQAPFFDTELAITPQDVESVTVRWQGQARRINDQVVNACPTQGETRFKVVSNNALTRAVWAGMQAQLPPAKADCVRTAFELDRVRPEWFDFNDPQPSGEDAKIDRAFAQCEAFLARPKAWGAQSPQSPQGHACTVAGVKTRCEGFFTASVNGKVQTISRETAIQRQLQNLPWSSGVREIASVRTARIQQEKDRVAREAAEEAAKLQAIEDARVQAERLAQEAKAAEQRALQDKIAALKVQIAEEKAQAAQEKNWVFKQIDKIKGVPAPEAKPQDASKPASPAAAAASVPATSAVTPSATPAAASPAQAAPAAGATPAAQAAPAPAATPAAQAAPAPPSAAAPLPPLPTAAPAAVAAPVVNPPVRSLPPLPPT